MSAKQRDVWFGLIPSTPLGPIWLAASNLGLTVVQVGGTSEELKADLVQMGFTSIYQDDSRLAKPAQQLVEYLHGERTEFDIPIDWTVMTAFQRKVLEKTFEIPYGETRTYAQLAMKVGSPRAARAVGRSQATNPMPLVVPCHRVLGSDGKLHGYGAGEGLPTKSWLLDLEAGS